jgi:uncharacterized membrane-anchored protein YitT (DUF2179 family)
MKTEKNIYLKISYTLDDDGFIEDEIIDKIISVLDKSINVTVTSHDSNIIAENLHDEQKIEILKLLHDKYTLEQLQVLISILKGNPHKNITDIPYINVNDLPYII